jgi:hybrid cluster-associated redox disulfide protein
MDNTETTQLISKEMTIEEIFSRFPQKSQKLAQEMTASGLHCVGCGAATWETLEAGMLSHGFSPEDVDDMVDRLNGILAQNTDLSTIAMTKRAADNTAKFSRKMAKKAGDCALGTGPPGAAVLNMSSITLKKQRTMIRPSYLKG